MVSTGTLSSFGKTCSSTSEYQPQPFRRPSALPARLWYPLPSDVQLTVDLVDQDRDDHLQPDLEQKADGGCQRSVGVGGVADKI